MRFISFCVISIVITSIFCCSCNNNGGANNVKVTFDTIRVGKVYHQHANPTKPSCSLDITYLYPIKLEKSRKETLLKVQSELNCAFFDDESFGNMTPGAATKKYFEEYINVFKQKNEIFNSKVLDENTEDSLKSFTKRIESKLLYNSHGIMSYQIISQDSKNNNTPISSYKNMTFDLHQGCLLTQDSIFVGDYQKTLSELIQQKIKDENHTQSLDTLFDIGFWGVEDIMPNDNFYIDNKGITYIYNPGECASLSLGVITVSIPFDDILDILKPNSSVAKLIASK